jgi:endonuclease G
MILQQLRGWSALWGWTIMLVSLMAFYASSLLAQNLLPHGTDTVIVSHAFYSLSFIAKHKQAEWVAYHLTDSMIVGNAERSMAFRFDPMVPGGSARTSDYRNSGYDKGHLCPAADMKWNAQAMKETFFMSNMSPQVPEFNRGIWKELEKRVRLWVDEMKDLFIVTGPVLQDSLSTIGTRNKVSIPNTFYKIIYRSTDSMKSMVAFLLPNVPSTERLPSFIVTVDSVESRTGIDFFPGLDDQTEEYLESRIDSTWISPTRWKQMR